jgi:two-component system, OmpR family, sensor histidine kinase RstB
MFKLLLKYMIGFIILGLVSIVILYVISAKMSESGFEDTIKTMNQGVFYSLQEQLKPYPPNQWSTLIQQLKPPAGNEAAIVPLSNLHFSNAKMRQLRAGKFVVVKEKDQFYFGYGVSEPISYQRINQSDYVLMMREIPITWIAHRISAWMTHLMVLELRQSPQEAWPEKLGQLQKIYGIPLAIIISSDMSFKNSDLVLSPPDSHGKIEYIYVWIEDNSILKIGPIPYLFYPQYQSYILVIIFVFIAIAFIILMTYIFSRNLDKIYRIAAQYSRIDFTNPPVVSKYSTLYTLYQNILRMGEKIQNLMNTQQSLTRFVAHECRTPISTMLFAIDNLEKENLSQISQANIQSIKADLADLNELVGAFLNYARFSNQDLPLNYQAVDINLWMQACIDKYRQTAIKISLSSDIPQNTLIEFDPNLMKHVISNLLENALKYADSQIQVSLELTEHICIIQVDNDGESIHEEDKQKIFLPFFRLDSEDNITKKGFGLGLTIAQMIMKRHHGSLDVTNSVLGGVRFTVCFPYTNIYNLNLM